MADAADRRLPSDEEIERLYNVMLGGLERRLARLGGRSTKPAEPIVGDATETLDLSK
jgi:hypothetical protein